MLDEVTDTTIDNTFIGMIYVLSLGSGIFLLLGSISSYIVYGNVLDIISTIIGILWVSITLVWLIKRNKKKWREIIYET